MPGTQSPPKSAAFRPAGVPSSGNMTGPAKTRAEGRPAVLVKCRPGVEPSTIVVQHPVVEVGVLGCGPGIFEDEGARRIFSRVKCGCGPAAVAGEAVHQIPDAIAVLVLGEGRQRQTHKESRSENSPGPYKHAFKYGLDWSEFAMNYVAVRLHSLGVRGNSIRDLSGPRSTRKLGRFEAVGMLYSL